MCASASSFQDSSSILDSTQPQTYPFSQATWSSSDHERQWQRQQLKWQFQGRHHRLQPCISCRSDSLALLRAGINSLNTSKFDPLMASFNTRKYHSVQHPQQRFLKQLNDLGLLLQAGWLKAVLFQKGPQLFHFCHSALDHVLSVHSKKLCLSAHFHQGPHTVCAGAGFVSGHPYLVCLCLQSFQGWNSTVECSLFEQLLGSLALLIESVRRSSGLSTMLLHDVLFVVVPLLKMDCVCFILLCRLLLLFLQHRICAFILLLVVNSKHITILSLVCHQPPLLYSLNVRFVLLESGLSLLFLRSFPLRFHAKCLFNVQLPCLVCCHRPTFQCPNNLLLFHSPLSHKAFLVLCICQSHLHPSQPIFQQLFRYCLSDQQFMGYWLRDEGFVGGGSWGEGVPG